MENLPRPAPAQTALDRLSEWLAWFGVARLVVSAAAVVVVCGGAFWLTRTPQPPIEAALPRAASGTVAAATLPPPPVAAAEAPGRVTVHVTGAVVRPGVYELAAGSRVRAAVDLAGGSTPDGDPNAINLAAVVVDGARVYVPVVGEEVSPSADGEPTQQGPVDVNSASTDVLDDLPGVGPATAAAIVTERERNGPFASVDDLERVPGIGPVKLEGLRELVTT